MTLMAAQLERQGKQSLLLDLPGGDMQGNATLDRLNCFLPSGKQGNMVTLFDSARDGKPSGLRHFTFSNPASCKLADLQVYPSFHLQSLPRLRVMQL